MSSHFWTFVMIQITGVMSHHLFQTLKASSLLPQKCWWCMWYMYEVCNQKKRSEMCVSSVKSIKHTTSSVCINVLNWANSWRVGDALQGSRIIVQCTRHIQKDACHQGPGWTVVGAIARCTDTFCYSQQPWRVTSPPTTSSCSSHKKFHIDCIWGQEHRFSYFLSRTGLH